MTAAPQLMTSYEWGRFKKQQSRMDMKHLRLSTYEVDLVVELLLHVMIEIPYVFNSQGMRQKHSKRNGTSEKASTVGY